MERILDPSSIFELRDSARADLLAPASLNLPTYTSLKAYGYTNIYELGPLLDVIKTKIPFEGTEVK